MASRNVEQTKGGALSALKQPRAQLALHSISWVISIWLGLDARGSKLQLAGTVVSPGRAHRELHAYMVKQASQATNVHDLMIMKIASLQFTIYSYVPDGFNP